MLDIACSLGVILVQYDFAFEVDFMILYHLKKYIQNKPHGKPA